MNHYCTMLIHWECSFTKNEILLYFFFLLTDTIFIYFIKLHFELFSNNVIKNGLELKHSFKLSYQMLWLNKCFLFNMSALKKLAWGKNYIYLVISTDNFINLKIAKLIDVPTYIWNFPSIPYFLAFFRITA